MFSMEVGEAPKDHVEGDGKDSFSRLEYLGSEIRFCRLEKLLCVYRFSKTSFYCMYWSEPRCSKYDENYFLSIYKNCQNKYL